MLFFTVKKLLSHFYEGNFHDAFNIFAVGFYTLINFSTYVTMAIMAIEHKISMC